MDRLNKVVNIEEVVKVGTGSEKKSYETIYMRGKKVIQKLN